MLFIEKEVGAFTRTVLVNFVYKRNLKEWEAVNGRHAFYYRLHLHLSKWRNEIYESKETPLRIRSPWTSASFVPVYSVYQFMCMSVCVWP